MSNIPKNSGVHLGSTIEATSATVGPLRDMLERHKIRKIADIPCGPGPWITQVTKDLYAYIGYNIKKETIEWKKYINKYKNYHYRVFDILRQIPKKVDATIFRDLAIHLSHYKNMIAINNKIKEDAEYILKRARRHHYKFGNMEIAANLYRLFLNINLKINLNDEEAKIINTYGGKSEL